MCHKDLLILLAWFASYAGRRHRDDPRFSLRREVAGPRPGRVHHERAFASPRLTRDSGDPLKIYGENREIRDDASRREEAAAAAEARVQEARGAQLTLMQQG